MTPKTAATMLYRMLAAASLAFACFCVEALEVPGPLVDTGWLADHLDKVVMLDVREDASSYLGSLPAAGQAPKPEALSGHIPGAALVAWKTLVAKDSEGGVPLKAMLPSAEAFTALMQECGVDNDSAVVVAGRGTSAKDQAYAARLYLALKYFGHDNAALLDGGTAQWAKEGRPLARVKHLPRKGDFVVTEIRRHLIADTREVDKAIESGDVQIVDCRTEDFYLGLSANRKLVSPEYKGHLPGAQTLPFVLLADNAAPARLFPIQQLRSLAALKGVDLNAPTIVYCNTGVTASLGWFVLHEVLGNAQTRLYDGSMHAWSNLEPSDALVSLAAIATEDLTKEPRQPPGAEGIRHRELIGRPPLSLQTLVDERRDVLRSRRKDYFDMLSGRRLLQPAWLVEREQIMEDYRASLRVAHRLHRDAVRYHRDLMRDAFDPLSRQYHEWSELKHFQLQMEQIERQERYDALRFSHAYVP